MDEIRVFVSGKRTRRIRLPSTTDEESDFSTRSSSRTSKRPPFGSPPSDLLLHSRVQLSSAASTPSLGSTPTSVSVTPPRGAHKSKSVCPVGRQHSIVSIANLFANQFLFSLSESSRVILSPSCSSDQSLRTPPSSKHPSPENTRHLTRSHRFHRSARQDSLPRRRLQLTPPPSATDMLLNLSGRIIPPEYEPSSSESESRYALPSASRMTTLLTSPLPMKLRDRRGRRQNVVGGYALRQKTMSRK